MKQRTKPVSATAFTAFLPCCIWYLVLHRYRDFQGLCRIQECQTARTLDHLHSLAFGLHGYLHYLAIDPCVPHA